MVKTDLENTHRERHFVHGAVTVEWFYFATVMQDNNNQGKQKGKTETKRTFYHRWAVILSLTQLSLNTRLTCVGFSGTTCTLKSLVRCLSELKSMKNKRGCS